MIKTRKLLLFLLTLASFLLQACGPDTAAAVATAIAETQQISELQTAAGGAGAVAQPTADAGLPSDTPSASVAFVSVSQNTNCRSGPRGDYILLTTINIGQPVEVLKTFSDEYVLVKNPNGTGDCWLFLQFADVTDFSAFNLEAATQPPTPTPTNTPKPTTPTIDWSGTWNFTGSKLTGSNSSVNIIQSGRHINGSFTRGPIIVTFSASLSADYRYAAGTWEISDGSGGSETGTFYWQISASNSDQFTGNWHQLDQDGVESEASYPWCGYRAGAPEPNPCLGP